MVYNMHLWVLDTATATTFALVALRFLGFSGPTDGIRWHLP